MTVFNDLDTEAQLAAVAVGLMADRDIPLGSQERRLTTTATGKPGSRLIDSLRADIREGLDPLGQAFIRLRSAEVRRSDGAVYTPPAIVSPMVAWASRQEAPCRIVDPGAGSGRFLLAAAKQFPGAQLVAIEPDPLARLLLYANAVQQGVHRRLQVRALDYRRIALKPIACPTVFIGNPPYVRHHQITGQWKAWLAKLAGKYGLPVSKLAGLHVHFFLQTLKLARPGDFGCFVTSSEWLDVNYGKLLRRMLTGPLPATAVQIIDPAALPFQDTQTTGVITCFHTLARPSDNIRVGRVTDADQLLNLNHGRLIDRSTLSDAPRWTRLAAEPGLAAREQHTVRVGDLFRVHRGQVTGANKVWIVGASYSGKLPRRWCRPTVTRAHELIAAKGMLRSTTGLQEILDLPVDLDELTSGERRQVDAFLRWAEEQGTPDGYVASHRRAWWSVQLRDPAPILCTYMARRPPVFVQNRCGASHINIAHGLYPRDPMDDRLIAAYTAYLNQYVSIADGRTYAGGLTKFEPGEIEHLSVPSIEDIHEQTSRVVAERSDLRCHPEHGQFSSGTPGRTACAI